MDEPHIPYAEWKRAGSEGHNLYDCIFMTFWKRQTIGSENRSVVSRDERELDNKEVGGNLFGGMMELFCAKTVVVDIWLYEFAKLIKLYAKRSGFYCELNTEFKT